MPPKTADAPASADHVELVEKTTPYQGYFRIERYRLRHKRFAGGWTEVMSRELFERGHATVVLPYDPLRDAVVLIEQFRVGAYAAGRAPCG
jgi:ADP-ribose pyrophosphatase